jgi:hypothetical protein
MVKKEVVRRLRLGGPFRLSATVTCKELRDDKRSLLRTIRVPRNAGLPSRYTKPLFSEQNRPLCHYLNL